MSEVKVNKISPRTACGTVTLGDSGDTIAITAGVNTTLGGAGSTITIPAGATITNSGTAAGFGATGAASWDTTVKTGDFTAVNGVGYFVNTTSGEIDVTLPAGTAGAVIAVADYANTADTNNIILKQNGSDKIEGSTDDFVMNQEGVSITLVYVDATKGWITTDTGNSSDAFVSNFIVATGGTIVECGNFRTHIFTGPGTFTVCSAGTPLGGPSNASYLVVAGGGGSAGPALSGAGGAGGFRYNISCSGVIPLTVQGYPISVGAGGATGNPAASKGANSIFSTITSAGGGASTNIGQTNSPPNANGGSGAGGPGADFPAPGPFSPGTGTAQNGGTGNTPPVSPSQGSNGGTGHGSYGTSDNGAGGGGGAGAVGGSTTSGSVYVTVGGNGLPVSPSLIGPTAPSYGTPGPAPGRWFSGGGGGVSTFPGTTGFTGGAGGGGDGGYNAIGGAGTVNTGGGAAGNTAAGGSGIVIIRYKFQ
ncbi:hypothetical protein OAP46_00155 [bacterium]|jgi:hypothetical protein|nr:hypothetical protein [bacterium]